MRSSSSGDVECQASVRIAERRVDGLGRVTSREDEPEVLPALRQRHQRLAHVRGDRDLLHPGHAPGACCFYSEDLGMVFTGDTLFEGGPGATGRSFSDFPTILDSIRDRLLTLPPDTVVHTGHGNDTTVGAEIPSLGEWIARRH